MTWFKGAFSPVVLQMEEAAKQKGILRHFITGAEPDWFYIVNDAQARTAREADLVSMIGNMMQSHADGIGILHVTGSSGSGKTTAIRSALQYVSNTYKFAYEFNEGADIGVDLLREVISRFNEKSIFIFYSAAEYYFAINQMYLHFSGRKIPYCLFILEDRISEYRKNRAQLGHVVDPDIFDFTQLSRVDASAIAEKIAESGLIFDKFSEFPLERRASIIMDKEKGYGGDLLSTLFSLTTHENFEEKIYQDYASVNSSTAKSVLDVVAIVNSLGFGAPTGYVAGMLGVEPSAIAASLSDDLAGVLIEKSGVVRCRHRIIANYYFKNCIAGRGDVEMMLEMLTFLSRQFSVEDIKHHPLAYRIYKNLISFEFLYEQFLPRRSRKDDAEHIYHKAQRLFGRDGIFWLQFGRYYRKVDNLVSAIDCFRTGLEFYDSFQTKHSLGVALLEKYVSDGCVEPGTYSEGVRFLEAERLRRGSRDVYPTSALIDLLQKISKANPQLLDAKMRIKECLNYGIKHFGADHYFREQLRRFMKGVDY
ncbi:hypothetical protein ASF73_10300 [Xanthomonas sp. Leaf131]|nr:hypothetical protein ASF73_10300 [Xanthomonas sp. Leaf131]